MAREQQQQQQPRREALRLFSPELRPLRGIFAKSLREMAAVITAVFWVSVCFLYGAGYDTPRYIKDARFVFRSFDDSPAARNLSALIAAGFGRPGVPLLEDYTGRGQYATPRAIDDAVWRGDAWGAVYINAGFGRSLDRALRGGAGYSPERAATLVTQESRHYFKVALATKAAQAALAGVGDPFARQTFRALAAQGAGEAAAVARANPVALVAPFGFTVKNIAPFHFDMSMYMLSVTLSLCMAVGAFIPSNVWKTIEEPLYRQASVAHLIGVRLAVNVAWAAFIAVQAAGCLLAFRGATWSVDAHEFFSVFGCLLLNTLALSFFVDCVQNRLHPRFLFAAYFVPLSVNISAALFGTELNSRFFRILYATPFNNTGIMLRTVFTRGTYQKYRFTIAINVAWTVLWWFLSTFLIARKARLVAAGKITMVNVPPPPSPPATAAVSEPASDGPAHAATNAAPSTAHSLVGSEKGPSRTPLSASTTPRASDVEASPQGHGPDTEDTDSDKGGR
ncbi:hypothetical protein H4R18_001347 [Coemansia javaensis]|uniref:DUF3533 domain-containing protein n=1 Tax=Coemansia javaensis TaxID=2761396 RepID=A0A9W8LKS3_9FUNG|nr:hypothetical protein H4R18_001347 [Coemansia javaensis]